MNDMKTFKFEAIKNIDEALELLTQLRVELVTKGETELEEKAFEIDSLLCELHDELNTK